jgi:hypothetical protein
MRFVPTRLHGAIDYAWGAALLLAPRLLHFPTHSAEARSCAAAGAGAVAYAALTDYELGLVPALTMREHLALDVIGGAALVASPWLFGFADRVRGPHVAFGLFAMAAGLVTRMRPEHGAALAAYGTRRAPTHRAAVNDRSGGRPGHLPPSRRPPRRAAIGSVSKVGVDDE